MQINQLKSFVVAAHFGSITKAAEHMYVSQPALTSSISLLEKELGITLFERNGRQTILSAAGKKILLSAQIILDECEIIKIVSERQKSANRNVTFSAPVIPLHTALLARSFKAAHPEFDPIQMASRGCSPEITVSATLEEHFSDTRKCLLTEDIALVVPSGHPLAGSGQIEFKDLKGLPIISMHKDSLMRKIEDHYFNIAGFTPVREKEIYALSDMFESIYAETGIVFFPVKTWNIETIWHERVIRLHNPRCYRHIFVEQTQYSNSNYLAVQAFFDFAVQFFQDHL